jgi:hypothetical protein
MSHLIPNLKCHIERVFSLYLQGGDSNEKISEISLPYKKLLTHYTLAKKAGFKSKES